MVDYLYSHKFILNSDKTVYFLIGIGFTSLICLYAFADAQRFLPSYLDKFLYLLSCVLQKPILLPILLPSRFQSYLPSKRYAQSIPKSISSDEGLYPQTTFVLAVQETNFLYSFTLSSFVAASTVFDILTDGNFE